MRGRVRAVGVLFGMVLIAACAPQPTATPPLVQATPTRALPTPTRIGTVVARVTPASQSSPTAQAAALRPSPLPTARARLYDDVDQLQILNAVYGNADFSQQPDGYLVNNNEGWKVWVNDREEGRITQADEPELLAVVANVVGPDAPQEAAAFGPSSAFLAILRRRDADLELVQREQIFPAVSPLAIDARLERVIDVDHDGQDELLATTNTVQSLITRTDARLYRWEDGKLKELWHGFEVNDNTAAVNQNEYSSYEATVDFDDLDNNGVDEIIVNGSLTSYSKDQQGRADLSAPATTVTEHNVYRWNGDTFVLDPALTTPYASAPTPTP